MFLSRRICGVPAMTLKHLNIVVSDVQQARESLVKYVGLDPNQRLARL